MFLWSDKLKHRRTLKILKKKIVCVCLTSFSSTKSFLRVPLAGASFGFLAVACLIFRTSLLLAFSLFLWICFASAKPIEKLRSTNFRVQNSKHNTHSSLASRFCTEIALSTSYFGFLFNTLLINSRFAAFSSLLLMCDALRLMPGINSFTPRPRACFSFGNLSWNLPTDAVEALATVAAVKSCWVEKNYDKIALAIEEQVELVVACRAYVSWCSGFRSQIAGTWNWDLFRLHNISHPFDFILCNFFALQTLLLCKLIFHWIGVSGHFKNPILLAFSFCSTETVCRNPFLSKNKFTLVLADATLDPANNTHLQFSIENFCVFLLLHDSFLLCKLLPFGRWAWHWTFLHTWQNERRCR